MIIKEMQEEKKILISKALPKLTEDLFEEYFISGKRLNYEDVYFSRRKFLSVFAIVGENSADYQKLDSIILDICSEKTWALPAHVDRSLKGWENTLDLFSSETAFALSEIISLHKNHLSPQTVNTAGSAVMDRVLKPFLNSLWGDYWWENVPMNWCAVCNSSIGAAAIYLLENEDEKKKLLDRVIKNLTGYLKAFPSDGCCKEGLYYFYYAFGHLLMFWDLLEEKTGYKTNWERIEYLNDIFLFPQKCLLSGGYTLSFSDSNTDGKLRIGVQAMMHKRNKEVFIPENDYGGFACDPCFRYGLLSRDVRFEKDKTLLAEGSKCKKNNELCFFPRAQWLIMNKYPDQSLAVKGGDNDEPHNHNDIGSLLWICGDDIILADLGAGEYTKNYFNDKTRYTYLCCRSLGHNVPLINCLEQTFGKEYQADDFSLIEGGVSMDLKKAYPKDCNINFYIRRVIMKDNCLKIEDDLSFLKPTQIEENFISLLSCEKTADSIILYGKTDKYVMTLSYDGSPETVKTYINEEKYFDHEGQKALIYRIGFLIKPCESVLSLKVLIKKEPLK
ncbi:MAG: hypothetical protein K5931_00570 [Lachnospiraceae bacterium]|nr:hypothetical protein [Lachnospiraceae bacterium]